MSNFIINSWQVQQGIFFFFFKSISSIPLHSVSTLETFILYWPITPYNIYWLLMRRQEIIINDLSDIHCSFLNCPILQNLGPLLFQALLSRIAVTQLLFLDFRGGKCLWLQKDYVLWNCCALQVFSVVWSERNRTVSREKCCTCFKLKGYRISTKCGNLLIFCKCYDNWALEYWTNHAAIEKTHIQ